MAQTHLELQPGFGDETVGEVHFVLHGDTEGKADDIAREGLRFTPGAVCVSANLEREAGKWAADYGRIIVLTVPPEFHVGYPVRDTAFIDRSEKMVIGAPMRYSRARAELSLYLEADTGSEAIKIESEILNGSPLEDHPAFTIDHRHILGGFPASSQLVSVLKRLEVSISGFEATDLALPERALTELFECREPAQAVMVPIMVHEVVVRMAESIVIAKMRMMRWQGLAALGYAFKEGTEEVKVDGTKDIEELQQQMEACKKSVESTGLFSGELAWLKKYVMRELGLMRIELSGAELEEG